MTQPKLQVSIYHGSKHFVLACQSRRSKCQNSLLHSHLQGVAEKKSTVWQKSAALLDDLSSGEATADGIHWRLVGLAEVPLPLLYVDHTWLICHLGLYL